MAFNFNWSPLAADSSFYTRAQELLTSALNKSPKPPIIVDDILVSELNLGSVPPELEILEVGDLAEDRFRGIFKMRYAGDAFLTLRTRVQANPMNTYLSTRPSFASPEPLAAGSSLTIPIKITLSEIKLSAFIILVFSKSKGLTLVFRNDPLESLKVSSTFDSIPFVRDFLQKTIDQQLRNLLMEDVPAIIHRLSLRLFVPEYRAQEEAMAGAKEKEEDEEEAADPFSSPPQDPVDLNGNPLGSAEISALSLESAADHPSVFSHSSILKLAALTDSHRTLSPFTPTMKDVLFRVWAGRAEQADIAGFASPISASLSRKQSQLDLKGTTYTFSNASDTASLTSRPSLLHSATSFSRSSLSTSKSGKPKKRKHRVINLRKQQKTDAGDLATIQDEPAFSETASTVTSDSASQADSAPASAPTIPTSLDTFASKYGVDDVATPPISPEKRLQNLERIDNGKTPQRISDIPTLEGERTLRRPQPHRALFTDGDAVLRRANNGSPSAAHHGSGPSPQPTSPVDRPSNSGNRTSHNDGSNGIPTRPMQSRYFSNFQFPSERPMSPFAGPSSFSSSSNTAAASAHGHRGSSPESGHHHHHHHYQHLPAPFPYGESAAPGGILEQAWMMKMAGEIARRMHEQDQQHQQEVSGGSGGHHKVDKSSSGNSTSIRNERFQPPPPPYAA